MLECLLLFNVVLTILSIISIPDKPADKDKDSKKDEADVDVPINSTKKKEMEKKQAETKEENIKKGFYQVSRVIV